MSQFNVGQAVIDLKIRAEQAEAEAAKLRKDLDDIKTKGEASGEGIGKGVSRATQSIGRLRSALIGIPATFTAFFALGRKIREVFELDGTKLIDTMRLINGLDFSNADESLKVLNQRMQELQLEAEAARSILGTAIPEGLKDLIGTSTLESRIALIQGAIETARRNSANKQAELEKQQAIDQYKQFKELNDKLLKEKADAAQKEKDRNDEEFYRAVQDEEEHKKYLKELEDKATQERIDNENRVHETRMRNLDEYERRLQDIIRQQEEGFGLSDAGVISGGAGLRGSILARFGRSSGGRG